MNWLQTQALDSLTNSLCKYNKESAGTCIQSSLENLPTDVRV